MRVIDRDRDLWLLMKNREIEIWRYCRTESQTGTNNKWEFIFRKQESKKTKNALSTKKANKKKRKNDEGQEKKK